MNFSVSFAREEKTVLLPSIFWTKCPDRRVLGHVGGSSPGQVKAKHGSGYGSGTKKRPQGGQKTAEEEKVKGVRARKIREGAKKNPVRNAIIKGKKWP